MSAGQAPPSPRRVALFGRKASAWWASKLAVGMTSITVMALAEGGIMMLLGLQVLHVPSFFWTLILFGWASMAVFCCFHWLCRRCFWG